MTSDNQALQPVPKASTDLTPEERNAKIANLMTTGDLGKMSKTEKDQFLVTLATLHNLSPWPAPFMTIPGQGGKEILYATKACTDQLRKVHGISLEITYEGPLKLGDQTNHDVYVARCKATDRDGRTDEEVGSVNIKGKFGDDLANQIMKAVTKAKRRVTLTITGLSLPSEEEVETFTNYQQAQQAPTGPRQINPGTRPNVGSMTVEVVGKDALPPVEAPK